MKTVSGALVITKTEAKAMREMIKHSLEDISYRSEGTFGDGEKFNERAAERVKEAISLIEWILEKSTK